MPATPAPFQPAPASDDLLAEIEEADPVFSDLPWNLYEPYA